MTVFNSVPHTIRVRCGPLPLSLLVVTLLGPVCWLIGLASKLVQEYQILCSKQPALEALANRITLNVHCSV